MPEYITEYANAADDGAPYAGPTLLATSLADAEDLAKFVRGPNGEPLIVRGELVERIRADVHGDTFTIVKRPEA